MNLEAIVFCKGPLSSIAFEDDKLLLQAEITFLTTFRYEKYHAVHGGDKEARKANYTDMVSPPKQKCFTRY